jgi:3-oxoacyl-[acyl-carrier protein] reductase
MDLGMAGRKAIVCASSSGLGKACATALAREGCSVVINGRDPARLAAASAEITAATGRQVRCVDADLNTEEGLRRLVAACPDADILVNNNGGPDPIDFLETRRETWVNALEANFLAPLYLIQALLAGMRERRFGRIVNITSARVKSPTAAMSISAAPRAALTALCKGLALESAASNVTLNNLLPERFETERTAYLIEHMVSDEGITADEARSRIAQSIPAKRLGQPSEFGDACAFLCSAQAGYISGQNLQLDGGSYRGLI